MTTQVGRPGPPRTSPGSDEAERSTRAQYMEAVERLSERLRRIRRRYNVASSVLILGIVLSLATGLEAGPRLQQGRMADINLAVALGLVGLGSLAILLRHETSELFRRRIAIAQHVVDVLEEEEGREDVAEETVDLDSLLRTNRNLLRQYHSISTEQAQEAFKMAKWVVTAAAVVFLLACLLALRGETVIGVSLAGAAVVASGVGGWVARTFLESYRISVSQAEAYFREPMVQGYLLAAHQIAQKMETPTARDQGLSRVMEGFLAAGLECARSRGAATPSPQQDA